MKRLFAVLAIMTLLATDANADCFCACIDGEVKSICTGQADVSPICMPMLCN